ncbi:hypothetical protein HU200_026431 [Digitaria exilis]|uniref:WRKY domain-containing protein n=1 Tax=Digitaria exilis TaxID=1010633 RepID=A0A835EVG7_9POAL|nr:hypothetical protein HU200_026431 [Digitaria exilis]
MLERAVLNSPCATDALTEKRCACGNLRCILEETVEKPHAAFPAPFPRWPLRRYQPLALSLHALTERQASKALTALPRPGPSTRRPVQRFEPRALTHTGSCLRREVARPRERGEDMDGCDGEKRALAAQLAQVLAMVRELESRMDQDLPAAARELCGELASSVDRSIRIARSVDGCPRGDGSQHPGGSNAQSKRRQVQPPIFCFIVDTLIEQQNHVSDMRLLALRSFRCSRKGTPCARRQDMAPLDDGLSWRKYGQKDILGAKYPRSAAHVTAAHVTPSLPSCYLHQTALAGCLATKHVQRADGDPLLYDVVYHGAHICAQAAHPAAEQLSRQLQPGGLADAGQEQSSPLEPENEGLQAGLEPMTPYSFAPATGAAAGGFPLLSPTGLEWQLSSHTVGGVGVGIEHEPQFAEFFTNSADPFQWEYQDDYLNLYATN